MLSYLLILNIIFFSGFNTIQINAEELEKESNSIDEELISEQQDETETSDTKGNMETDTDTVLETDLSQPLEQKILLMVQNNQEKTQMRNMFLQKTSLLI